MRTYVVERIEWCEAVDMLDYRQHSSILHSFTELSAARMFVEDDSGYYTYDNWRWSGARTYVGYRETSQGNSGVRYEIRLVPHS